MALQVRPVNNPRFLGIARPQPQPRLTVARPQPQPRLTVTRNYGFQGNTYNPQPAWRPPVRTWNPQPAAPARRVQPASNWNAVQAAATARVVAQAAHNQRIRAQQLIAQQLSAAAAARAEAARQAEIRRQAELKRQRIEAQKKRINTGKQQYLANQQKAALTLKRITAPKNHKVVKVGGKPRNLWDDARRAAGFGSLVDAENTREGANAKMNDNNKNWFKQLENERRQLEKDQARVQEQINQASANPGHGARVQAAVDDFNLKLMRFEGKTVHYNTEQERLAKKAGTKATGKAAKLNEKLYNTLGKPVKAGWNAFSFGVTALNRGVNTLGNLNTPDRVIYKDDQTTTVRKQGGIKAAWNATKGQRVNNVRPYHDIKSTKDKRAGEIIAAVDMRIRDMRAMGTNPKVINREKMIQDAINKTNQKHKFLNTATQFLGDPLMWLPGGGLSRGVSAAKASQPLKFIGKSTKARDAVLTATAATNLLGDTKLGRGISWLGRKTDEPTDRSKFYEEHLPDVKKARNQATYSSQKNLEAMRRVQKQRELEKPALESAVKSWNETKSKYDARTFDRIKNMAGKPKYSKKDHPVYKKQEALLSAIQKYRSDTLFSSSESVAGTKKAESFAGLENDPLIKGLTEAERRKVMKESYKMSVGFEKIYQGDISRGLRYQRRKGYIHGSGKKSDGTGKAGKGAPAFTKAHISRTEQGAQEFAKNQYNRAYQSMHLENPLGSQVPGMVKRDKAMQEEITRRYKKLAAGTSRANKALTPFERLVGNKTVAPARTTNEKLMRNDNYKLARKAARAASPNALWRKAVLTYRPAWHVNNAIWNEIASVSAGGAGVLKQQAKLLTNKGYRAETQAERHKINGSIRNDIGNSKIAQGASKLENFARHSTYLALKKKGYSDEAAKRRTNDWLFDYSNRNWERPIRAAMPFWNWNKGLFKLGAKMPLEYPRHALTFGTAYREGYEKPNNRPADMRTYKDKMTGKQMSYDANAKYKGKVKVGDRYYNTPWNAITEDTMSTMSMNPWVNYLQQSATGKDKFGRSLAGLSGEQLLGDQFPQAKLARQFASRNKKTSDSWFAESGYGKQAQGYDKSKKNYRADLDNKKAFRDNLGSFFGVPKYIRKDDKADAEHRRYTDFNKEYFKTDWDKRAAQLEKEDSANAYNRLQAEKEAVFKKHGYTPEEIYKGKWSKYDTATTSNTKRLKEEAFEFGKKYWDEYNKIPDAAKFERSKKRPFWLKTFKDFRDNKSFADNPYKKFPGFNEKDANGVKTGKKNYVEPAELQAREDYLNSKPKSTAINRDGKWFKSEASYQKYLSGKVRYQKKLDYDEAKATGDWSKFEGKYGSKKQSPFQFQGKFFKSAESMERYKNGVAKYESRTPGVRKESPYQFEGKFFKTAESMEKYKEGSFWRAYFETDDFDKRQEMLDKNPKYRRFNKTTNFEESLAARRILKKSLKEKAEADDSILKYMADYRKNVLPRNFTKRPKKLVFRGKK